MAIAYVAGATARGSAGVATLTYPAGIQAGHIMVMAITWKRGSGTFFFVPPGWTMWERLDGLTATYQNMLLTKEADGTESGTTLNVNDGATQQGITVALAVYSGAHVVPRTRNVTVANAGAADTTVECPDPGGNQTGDRRIIFALARGSLNGPSGSPNFTAVTAGFTIRQQITDISGSAQNSATAIADGTGTGTVVFTANAATYAIGGTMWLREGTPTAHSVFTSQTPSGTNSNESAPYTLATTFYPTVDGFVTGARWRFPDTLPTGAAGGSVTAGVWEYTSDTAGTLLGTTSFIGPTAGTWNTANFTTPIKVKAGSAYVVGIYTPDRYVGTTNGFTGTTITNGYLVAPATGADPVGLGSLYNGRLHAGGAGLTWPETSYMGSNYFADVVFVAGQHPTPNRMYLTSTVADYTPVTIRGSWADTTRNAAWKLGPRPEGEATASSRAEASATNNYNVLLGRWVSAGASRAGTVTGSMNWCIGVLESNAALNAFFRFHVFVTVGDSDVVRGVLRSEIVNTTEWISTSAVGRTGNNWTLTSTAIQPGDRLVIEVGFQAQNTVTTSYTGTLYHGTQGAIDLKLADPNVSSLPGWVEFTGVDGLWWDSAGDITDDFDDGTLDTADRWAGSWIDVAPSALPIETGGRARIYCNTGYGSLQSRPWLYFRDTSLSWEMVTLANGATGTAEVYFKGSVDSATPGRYLGWYLNLKTNELRAFQAVDYWDGSSSAITFNATNHRWLQIREANGTVYFETSANGTTWTVQRSVPTPYWCSYKDSAASFEAHRDAGTADYFEIDNVNTGPPSNVSLSRDITDTVTAGDGSTRVLLFPRSLGDALAAADAASASVARSRAVADALALLDSAGRATAGARAAADAVTVLDAASRSTVRSAAAADAVTVLDTAGRVILAGRAVADAVVLADANTRGLAQPRVATDSTTLADAGTRTITAGRAGADSLGLVDAAGRSLLRTRAVAEAVTAADTAAGTRSTMRTMTDSTTLADAATRAVAGVRAVGEAVTTADAVSRGATAWIRPVAETVAVADTATRALLRVRSMADSLAFTDMVAAAQAQARSRAESVNVVDAATRAVAAVAAVAELVALANAVASGVAVVLSGSDALNLADSAARTATYGRAGTDTVAAVDVPGRAVSAARTAANAVAVADAVTRTQARSRSVADSLNLVDALTRSATAGRSVAELVTLAAAASRAVAGQRAVAESVAFTDLVLSGSIAVVVVADAVSLADAATSGRAMLRSRAESVTAVDAATGRRTFGRTTVDAVSFADLGLAGQLTTAAGAGAVTLADGAARSLAAGRSPAQTVTVVAVPAAQRSLGRSVANTVTLAELVFGGQLLTAAGVDAVALADTARAARTVNRIVANAVGAGNTVARSLAAARSADELLVLLDAAQGNPTVFAYGSAAVSVAANASRTLASGARGFDVLVLLDTVSGVLALVPVRPSQSVTVPVESGTSVVAVQVASAEVDTRHSGIVVLVPSKRIIVPVTGG